MTSFRFGIAVLALLGPLAQADKVKFFDGVLTQEEIDAFLQEDKHEMPIAHYTMEQKRRGEVRVGNAITERIKKTLGLSQDCSADDGSWTAQTRLMFETTYPHTDRFQDTHMPVTDDVALIFLNDNENARFVSGDDEVPVVAGRLAVFQGNVFHHTKISSGTVNTLGPFHASDFVRGVGEDGPNCEFCVDDDGDPGCVVRKFKRRKGEDTCLHICMSLKGFEKASSKRPDIFQGLGCSTGQCEDPNSLCNFWWWKRRLDGDEEDITVDDAHRALEKHNADPQGFFDSKDSIITDESLLFLKEYLKEAYANDDFDPSKIPAWRTRNNNLPPEAQLNHKITGEKLVELIGVDEAGKLLDYWHETFGEDSPVTSIVLQMSRNTEFAYFSTHRDKKNVMLVYLDNEFEGGGVGYYDTNGYTLVEAEKGKVLIHGANTLHKSESFKGWRPLLEFQGSGKGECKLKKYLEDRA